MAVTLIIMIILILLKIIILTEQDSHLHRHNKNHTQCSKQGKKSRHWDRQTVEQSIQTYNNWDRRAFEEMGVWGQIALLCLLYFVCSWYLNMNELSWAMNYSVRSFLFTLLYPLLQFSLSKIVKTVALHRTSHVTHNKQTSASITIWRSFSTSPGVLVIVIIILTINSSTPFEAVELSGEQCVI